MSPTARSIHLRRNHVRASSRRTALTPYLFLLPTFIFLAAFAYQPFVTVILDSFYNYDGSFERIYIGVDNFRQLLFHDPLFWSSMRVVAELTGANIVKVLIFPLLAAEMVHLIINKRMAYWYRFWLLVPTVIPILVTVFVWRLFYLPDPAIGLINKVLVAIGGNGAAQNWLGSPHLALWSLVLMNFPWVGGVVMLIYLAGLQRIPAELYDAASVDGASVPRRFWSIELPLISKQLKVIVIITLIGGLQDFSGPFLMTGGGPLNSTLVPGLYLYNQAFMSNQVGYASAIAVVLFVFMMILSLMASRMFKGVGT